MLKVKYGPFQPALEEAFLTRLRQLRKESPLKPIAVVTPSRRLADRLQRLAADDKEVSLLGVHFHTFYSLAVGIIEDSGFGNKKLMGDGLFHDRLIDWILTQDRRFGTRFGGAAKPKALASALRSSLRDLIDAGVAPGDIADQLDENLIGDGRSASARFQDLLELEEEYLDLLDSKGILSPSGLTALAAAKVEGSRFLAQFGEFLYYGFYDLTGLQLDFFERVTDAHPSTLFFPYVQGHPAFRFCEDFFELKLHREGPPERLPDELGGSPVAKAFPLLFAVHPGDGRTGRESIRILNASGARDELWSVAKEIVKLVEREGFDFDSIGVVARTLEPYRDMVGEIFGENAIPHSLAGSEPLLRHPFAKMAQNLLTLVQRDFSAYAVSDLFHSPYFDLETAADLKSARRLRASAPGYIDRLQIAGGWPVWEAKLRRAAQGPADAEIPAHDAGRMLKLLEALRDELAGGAEKSWSEWASRAKALIGKWLNMPKSAVEREQNAREAVFSILDGLSAFDLLGSVSWDFFLDTVVEKMATFSTEPAKTLGVRVLGSMDARGESFRVLFLIGLQEGVFPRQVREDPLLPDNIRAQLRHPGGYWIAKKASGHEEERLLFALNVMSARERLYCVYSRSDEDGRAKAPSIYLRELCRAAGIDLHADAEHVFRQPTAKLSQCPPELLSPRESDILSGLAGSGIPSQVLAMNAWGPAGEMDGIIGTPKKYTAHLRQRGLSPTALEKFSTCPFQFFSSNVLKMGDVEDEPEQGHISPKLKGEMYHAILENFYRGLHESRFWEKKHPPEWTPSMESAMNDVFSKYSWKDLGVYPLVWTAARADMRRHLTRFVEWDMTRIRESGLFPAFFEQELRGPLALSKLPEPLAGLPMRGRADRIDVDPTGEHYRVIDYKTSWRRYGTKRLAGLILAGRMYQLPVYAELAQGVLGKKAELDEACCYLLEDSLEETDRDPVQSYPSTAWKTDRQEIYKGIETILNSIADGWFPIRPEDDEHGHCRHCSFSSICRKSHGPSRQRAEAAYEKSSLKQIHERKRNQE